MREAVITTAEQSVGAHAFKTALERHGISVQFRTLLAEALTPSHADLKIDRSLPPYDFPIRVWEHDDTSWWNRPDLAWDAWSKAVTARTAIAAGIPHVPTIEFDYLDREETFDPGLIPAVKRAEELVDLLELPVVVKPDRRSIGENVSLAKDIPELRFLMASVRHGVVQPYIPEGSRSLRLVVAAGEVMVEYARIAREGQWKANVETGARIEPVSSDSETRRIALQSVMALGLDFAGVDVIETAHGPLLLEVNPAFGVQGLNEVTNGNGVDAIIDRLLDLRSARF